MNKIEGTWDPSTDTDSNLTKDHTKRAYETVRIKLYTMMKCIFSEDMAKNAKEEEKDKEIDPCSSLIPTYMDNPLLKMPSTHSWCDLSSDNLIQTYEEVGQLTHKITEGIPGLTKLSGYSIQAD